MNMQTNTFDTSMPAPSDEETEAQIFRALKAARTASRVKGDAAILLRHPDTRTALQRLRAWWHLRRKPATSLEVAAQEAPVCEPDWYGHWATVKHL